MTDFVTNINHILKKLIISSKQRDNINNFIKIFNEQYNMSGLGKETEEYNMPELVKETEESITQIKEFLNCYNKDNIGQDNNEIILLIHETIYEYIYSLSYSILFKSTNVKKLTDPILTLLGWCSALNPPAETSIDKAVKIEDVTTQMCSALNPPAETSIDKAETIRNLICNTKRDIINVICVRLATITDAKTAPEMDTYTTEQLKQLKQLLSDITDNDTQDPSILIQIAPDLVGSAKNEFIDNINKLFKCTKTSSDTIYNKLNSTLNTLKDNDNDNNNIMWKYIYFIYYYFLYQINHTSIDNIQNIQIIYNTYIDILNAATAAKGAEGAEGAEAAEGAECTEGAQDAEDTQDASTASDVINCIIKNTNELLQNPAPFKIHIPGAIPTKDFVVYYLDEILQNTQLTEATETTKSPDATEPPEATEAADVTERITLGKLLDIYNKYTTTYIKKKCELYKKLCSCNNKEINEIFTDIIKCAKDCRKGLDGAARDTFNVYVQKQIRQLITVFKYCTSVNLNYIKFDNDDETSVDIEVGADDDKDTITAKMDKKLNEMMTGIYYQLYQTYKLLDTDVDTVINQEMDGKLSILSDDTREIVKDIKSFVKYIQTHRTGVKPSEQYFKHIIDKIKIGDIPEYINNTTDNITDINTYIQSMWKDVKDGYEAILPSDTANSDIAKSYTNKYKIFNKLYNWWFIPKSKTCLGIISSDTYQKSYTKILKIENDPTFRGTYMNMTAPKFLLDYMSGGKTILKDNFMSTFTINVKNLNNYIAFYNAYASLFYIYKIIIQEYNINIEVWSEYSKNRFVYKTLKIQTLPHNQKLATGDLPTLSKATTPSKTPATATLKYPPSSKIPAAAAKTAKTAKRSKYLILLNKNNKTNIKNIYKLYHTINKYYKYKIKYLIINNKINYKL